MKNYLIKTQLSDRFASLCFLHSFPSLSLAFPFPLFQKTSHLETFVHFFAGRSSWRKDIMDIMVKK